MPKWLQHVLEHPVQTVFSSLLSAIMAFILLYWVGILLVPLVGLVLGLGLLLGEALKMFLPAILLGIFLPKRYKGWAILLAIFLFFKAVPL